MIGDNDDESLSEEETSISQFDTRKIFWKNLKSVRDFCAAKSIEIVDHTRGEVLSGLVFRFTEPVQL